MPSPSKSLTMLSAASDRRRPGSRCRNSSSSTCSHARNEPREPESSKIDLAGDRVIRDTPELSVFDSSAPPHRVVITGLGCITPIGSTVDEFRTSLYSATTGISPIAGVYDAPDGNPGVRFTQAAQIFDFDPTQHLTSGVITATNRNTQFGIVTARQAVQQSGLLQHHPPDNIAIIMGCACGGRSSEEVDLARLYRTNARAHPLTIIRTMSSAGASNISIDLRITGPTLDISTACASSTHAIGLAFQMVRSGMVSAALTGGHEAPLSFGFYRAWGLHARRLPAACRPFSADRERHDSRRRRGRCSPSKPSPSSRTRNTHPSLARSSASSMTSGALITSTATTR